MTEEIRVSSEAQRSKLPGFSLNNTHPRQYPIPPTGVATAVTSDAVLGCANQASLSSYSHCRPSPEVTTTARVLLAGALTCAATSGTGDGAFEHGTICQ